MATSAKHMDGWTQEITIPEGSPRRRRGTANTDSIVLRRGPLVLQRGDTVLVRVGDGEEVVLIRLIEFGIHAFIDIAVQWFIRGNTDSKECTPESSPAKAEGSPSAKAGAARALPELYASAAQGKLWLSDYIAHVVVVGATEPVPKTMLEVFRCTFACDEMGESTTAIEWHEFALLVKTSPVAYVERIRALAVAPTRLGAKRLAQTAETHDRMAKRSRREVKAEGEKVKTKVEEVKIEAVEEVDSEVEEVKPEAVGEIKALVEGDKIDAIEELGEASSGMEASDLSEYASLEVDSGGEVSDEEFTNKFYLQKRAPSRRGPGSRVKQKLRPAPRRLQPPVTSKFSRLRLPQVAELPQASPFVEVKTKLHASLALRSLPCREEEFMQIYLAIESAVTTCTGCCLYVSGTPGVGKTATVREVIGNLQELVEQGGLEEFDYCEINGLKLVAPTQAYEHLWAQVGGERATATRAAAGLEAHFQAMQGLGAEHPRVAQRRPLVVLVDELDQVVTRSQSVLYNLFNWPTYTNSKLVVIAVANTMDLPERLLSNKVSSRLGLVRIQFAGYTFQQLTEIIKARLNMITGQRRLVVSEEAVEFAARKVANISGDARRALAVCRRAVDIAEAREMAAAKSVANASPSLENTVAKASPPSAKTVANPVATTSPLSAKTAVAKPAVAKTSPPLAKTAATVRRLSAEEVEPANSECEALGLGERGTSGETAASATVEGALVSPTGSSPFHLLISDVMAAINETISSPIILQLQTLSFTAKLFLAALMLRHKRSQLAEVRVGDIIDEMRRMVVLNSANTKLSADDDNLLTLLYNERGTTANLRVHQFHHTLEQLVEMGILMSNSGMCGALGYIGERHLLVKLNVSREEVSQALKTDRVLRGMI